MNNSMWDHVYFNIWHTLEEKARHGAHYQVAQYGDSYSPWQAASHNLFYPVRDKVSHRVRLSIRRWVEEDAP